MTTADARGAPPGRAPRHLTAAPSPPSYGEAEQTIAQAQEPAAFRDAVQAFWLAESDRADMWQQRILAAERRGYERGRADGYAGGKADAERDMAASWRAAAYPLAQPDAYRREVAARCVRAAETGERRDAAEHERAFVARAYSTPAGQRTDVQSATVRIYPPRPRRKASAA